MSRGFGEYLRSWWQRPFDFDWTARHFRATGAVRVHQVSIGGLSLIYGFTALLVVWWSQTDTTAVTWRLPVLVIAASSIIAGLRWMFGRWPTERESLAFAIYADVSVFVAVLCCADAFTAMPGLALLAANGIYVVVFHGPRVLLTHLLFAAAAFAWIAGLAVEQGTAPGVVIAIRVLVLFPAVMGSPVLVQSYLLALRVAAADALFDPLTRLHNRRGLESEIDELAREAHRPIGVLAIDIDKFKAINDGHGHDAGDRVLVAVANAARDTVAVLGVVAVIARTGGEEFVVVVCAEAWAANRLADLLHRAVARIETDMVPTVSIGVATSRAPADGIRDLIESADAAMYLAKNAGGGQTVLAESGAR